MALNAATTLGGGKERGGFAEFETFESCANSYQRVAKTKAGFFGDLCVGGCGLKRGGEKGKLAGTFESKGVSTRYHLDRAARGGQGIKGELRAKVDPSQGGVKPMAYKPGRAVHRTLLG